MPRWTGFGRQVFPRARMILRNTSGRSAATLLLAAAQQTRPGVRGISRLVLDGLSRDGYLPYRYKLFGTNRQAFLRLHHLESDLQSALELAVGDCYRLERLGNPDLIVDGGANIGMFSLAASARWPNVPIIACEPVPHNVAAIRRHVALNGLERQVQVREVALADREGTLDFYVREANQGSFDPRLPWQSTIRVPLLPLRKLIEGRPVRRLLVKLDIEGAEVDVLRAFFESDVTEEVSVVMELHETPRNRKLIEELAARHHLRLEFYELGTNTAHCQITSAD